MTDAEKHDDHSGRHHMSADPTVYTCPMHPEIRSASPGTCPICGMKLVPVAMTEGGMDHHEHTMKPGSEMSRWDRFKMSMTMTMGMEHSGVAGREMARLMELDIRNKFFFALVLSVPIILYSPLGKFIFGIQLPAPFPVPWLLFLLTTPVYFYSGWIFLYSSFRALQQRTLNMSVLIATGITAAYSFSVLLTILQSADSYYEATALLITFVLFGHWLEMRSRRGTTDALEALLQLVPPQARVLREGKEILVPTSQVGVGDMIVLKPGDRVPVDGRIVEGETAIDESLVTGESLPVAKTVGNIVIGGSINQSGSVKFEATKVGEETALAQIVRLVEAAQNSKAPGQRLADRFAQYLVVLAIGAGLVTFLVWFGVARQSVLTALTFAISAIVIACPDALGLATPTAVAVGTGLGAKHNILIKDAPTLEGVSKIQAVVFDKTGTLTEGKPRISEIATIQDWDENEALRLVGGAEAESNHPLSSAVLEEVKIRGDNVAPAETVAKMVGIKRVYADVLPKDKALFVKKLQDEGKFVAMVGDGVNDAPALAQADIGIAIGAGTDVAIETAKVVLMKSDPSDVLRAIRLSKATVTKMKQNLFWASFYNILAIPVAAGILYPNFGIILRPEISALLMSASSIIVATNAVLLKRTEKNLVAI